MNSSTVILYLFILLFCLNVQTLGQENTKNDLQSVSSNTVDKISGESTNNTDLAVPDTPQDVNPDTKQSEQLDKNIVNKPRRKPTPRPRRRRPGRRKRPRRPRKPAPTPKPQEEQKQNTTPKPKSNSEKTDSKGQGESSLKEPDQRIPNINTKEVKEIKQANQGISMSEIYTPANEQTKPKEKTVQAEKTMLAADTNKKSEPQAQTQSDQTMKSKQDSETKQIINNNEQPVKPKLISKTEAKNNTHVSNEPMQVKETKNVSKAKPDKVKPTVENSPQGDTFADLEGFFDQFDTATEANLQPPPQFDPNKPPGKKVMPTVDPSKGIAHDGTPCAENYKPDPNDTTKYMMRLPDNVWVSVDCPPNLSLGLVWRQDLCNCGEELVPVDPDDMCAQQGFTPYPNNRHKYKRRHHGINNVMDCPANLVWSQQVCLCLFDPDAIKPIEPTVTFVCKTILNLTFEDRLQNTAEGYYVKPVAFGRRSKIPRIRFVKTPGADGLAAQIVSQPLQFQAFRGNDFQKQVTFSLNFKVSRRRKESKNFMLLLTDECERTQSGINKQWEPSISLSFQPSTQTFKLLFRTEEKLIQEIIKGAKPDSQDWYKVVVYFEDKTVNLENNGKKIFSVNGVQGKIPPNRCPLYIAGRGKGYDMKQNFYGYMDNIFLVKDCKFHESNIKIL